MRSVSGGVGHNRPRNFAVLARFLRLILIGGGAPKVGIDDQVEELWGPFPASGVLEDGLAETLAAIPSLQEK